MDLTLSERELRFRDELRAFLAEALPPGRRPAAGAEERLAEQRAWQRTLGEGGWAVPGWPRRYGGRDAGPVELMLYEHELGRARAPQALNVIGTGWAGAAILRHGSEEQRRRHLPPIPCGERIWCQLFSEPEAGSDLASLATRARPAGDGWRIDGQKVWSSYAQVSDRGLLLARTGPPGERPRHAGISCFLLDMHQPGVTVRPIRQITGESEFNEVFLDSVPVSGSDLLGRPGEGWAVAVTTLMSERIGLSAGEGTLWGRGPTFADVLDLWGRLRDGGELPGGAARATLRDELARLYIEGEALRLTGLRMLSAMERAAAAGGSGGRPGDDAARLGALAGTQMSVRKLAADLWGQQVHEAVWRMLGPRALLDGGSDRAVDGGAWQRAYLFARALTIGGGTTEVQRDILARRILGLPGR